MVSDCFEFGFISKMCSNDEKNIGKSLAKLLDFLMYLIAASQVNIEPMKAEQNRTSEFTQS